MLRLLCNLLTRIVATVFAILAVVSAIECRKLLKTGWEVSNEGTLYVPLLYCEPTSVTVNDVVYSTDAEAEGTTCETKDVVVNACALSLLLTVIALILFLIVDCLARCKVGCFKRNLAMGMALFLIFIIFQSVLNCGGLVEELMHREEVYQDLVDELAITNAAVEGLTVSLHGNTGILMATVGMGITTIVLVFFDALFNLCAGEGKDESDDGGSIQMSSTESRTSGRGFT